jgi:hypothetical protein
MSMKLNEFFGCSTADFRSGRSMILVATDVAARGLGKQVQEHSVDFVPPSIVILNSAGKYYV